MGAAVFLIVAVLPFTLISGARIPVKDGVYRISNALDDGFLTATKKTGENQEQLLGKCTHPGEVDEELVDDSARLPKLVITSTWKSLPTQEWKVKTSNHGGSPLQIIRNEKIRDNEVSKRVNYEKENDSENDFVPIDFNLENQNDEGYFEVTNGFGCLESQGFGKEVLLECECDQTLKAQQWKFEFLYDIKPTKGTADK